MVVEFMVAATEADVGSRLSGPSGARVVHVEFESVTLKCTTTPCKGLSPVLFPKNHPWPLLAQ